MLQVPSTGLLTIPNECAQDCRNYARNISGTFLASCADVLGFVTRSSPRNVCSTDRSHSSAGGYPITASLSIRAGKAGLWPTSTQHFNTRNLCRKMCNILTYVRFAPATADVQIGLQVLATDKIHIEDRNHGLARTKSNNGICNTPNSQLIST